MRPGAFGLLLLLLAACSSGPIRSFDAGHDVHFIVRADPPPSRAFRIHPVCTVGAEVVRLRQIRVGPGEPAAREVAIVRTGRGEQRISVWEPRTRTDGRATVDVERDLWVVVDLGGRLTVHETPPNDEVGAWEFLVPVPE